MTEKFQVCVLNYSSGFREVSEALHHGLLEAGFEFELPEWEAAARDLVARARRRRNRSHRGHAASTMGG